ncbi:MAG: penicillin acylase family protein, partial [Proteobacteria bacterium]|nr:penicillin acylase family protein [Pseudomonadota bacterium]
MRVFKLVATLSCCVIVFALLNSPVGDLPPLGRFLNPFAGFWTNNRAQDVLPVSLEVPGLTSDVEILWDKRRVPHIVAQNLHDLFLTQGYVVARDRLWQMDFQARAAAGRLSEIVGAKALEHDRFRRRIGLATAAEQSLTRIMSDPESLMAAEAFSDGVNAWIDGLTRSTLPLEYKILDYEPEPWSPLKSALLLKAMSYTLTFRHSELSMTRTAEVLDKELMDQLYPERQPFVEPAIPAETRWGFTPLRSDSAAKADQPRRGIVRGADMRPKDPGYAPDEGVGGS